MVIEFGSKAAYLFNCRQIRGLLRNLGIRRWCTHQRLFHFGIAQVTPKPAFLMKSLIKLAALLFALPMLFPNSVLGQSKPSSEAAKSFLDFYYSGQGKGVVMADLQVCTDVVEAKCVETVDPSLLQAGMKYKIWMAFVVPEGDEVTSLSLQFSKDGQPQYTRDITSVKGSIRYRTWKNFNPTDAAIWEVKVMDNREIELEELGKLSLVVSQ